MAGTFLAQEAADSEYRTVTAAVVMLAAACMTFLWQHHSKCRECWLDLREIAVGLRYDTAVV